MNRNIKVRFHGLLSVLFLSLVCSLAGAQEVNDDPNNPDAIFEAMQKKVPPLVREMTEDEKNSLVKVELEKKKEEEKFKKMSPSGVIASFGGGVGSQTVGTLSEVATTKSDQPPLAASVKKESGGWSVKVSNSSKKHVSATIKVEQYRSGRKSPSKTDNLSVSLAGGSEVSRVVSSGPDTQSVQVAVVSWKSK
jgi:hypothetical protein